MTPVPYLGSINKAKVFLLQLNPGVYHPPGIETTEEREFGKVFPEFLNDHMRNLRQEKMEYPFISLNPRYRLFSGFRYWSKIFKEFLTSESDYKRVSQKVCCIEFFPYHSKRYRSLKGKPLPSQRYNFLLVKNLIDKRKTIVLMRGENQWFKVLKGEFQPEVRDWKQKIIRLKNSRNVPLTKNNFVNEKDFRRIKRLLDRD